VGVKKLVRLCVSGGCAAIIAAVPATAQAASPGGPTPYPRPVTGRSVMGTVSPQDRAWLASSAQANRFEIVSGGLAARKGTRAATRAVASRIEMDHLKALAALIPVAFRLHIPLPTVPSADQRSKLRRLRSLQGIPFDREFLTVAVAGHRANINAALREIQFGTNPSVKAQARNNLPVPRTHLMLAERALAQLPPVP